MPAIQVNITSKRVLDRARSQLGVTERPAGTNRTPYSVWYGIIGPWCAMFVSWCFYMAGAPLRITTSKGFAYCPFGVDWFKKHGAWASPATKPKPGWIVFYDFIGRPSHTGIVEGVAADGRIIALEGNTNAAGSRTGGSVMRHYRKARGGGIIGYGMISYKSATVARRTLREGMSGSDVAAWQKLVNVTADGQFGPKTKAATIAFQRKMKLVADGVVGPKTYQAMDKVLAYLVAISRR